MENLRTRPTAETFPLDDLIDYARVGKLRVPSFQRGLRWTRRDVVLLFDSVVKGYPVGSLLLWERPAGAEVVELGPLRVEAPAGQAFYVVDGQQRITALASALTEQGWGDPRFAVGYDLEADRFTSRPVHESDTWVPAHVLYDLSKLLTWFREREGVGHLFESAAAVSKALRDVRLPAYVVRQDDEEVLRAIFDRMNNAGKKLTRGEVFAALHQGGAAEGERTLATVAESLQLQTGFGRLDDGLVMRMILARRGADVMREIRNEFEAGAKGRDAFAAAEPEVEAYVRGEAAAVSAIRFLQQHAGVPHQAFLPYQYLLVTLARFFAHHPTPGPRHLRLLRRFYWRAVMHGPGLVPGSTTGVGRMLNRKVDPVDELGSLTRLLSLVEEAHADHPSLDPFKTNTAASKVLLCAMWRQGPRSLVTGERVTDEELQSALGERLTAVAVVRPLASGPQMEGHELDAGNRLLLVPEVDRESDPVEGLLAASSEVIASHGLDDEDAAALRDGNALQVVERRAQWLFDWRETFVAEMCEWDQEDTPDLHQMTLQVNGA